MRQIRIYVEGGGKDKKLGPINLRQGFEKFFGRLVHEPRAQHIRVIACGSRSETFKDFQKALNSPNTGDALLMLVDSEGPLRAEGWAHLTQQEGWTRPQNAGNDACHYMVQCLESWIVADPEALVGFYGDGFHSNSLPKRADLEDEPKQHVLSSLKQATKNTSKGEYHKTLHGLKLIGLVDPDKVKERCPHCKKVFATLAKVLG